MDFEQINPVFTTAKTTTHMLAGMGIPYADIFDRELGFDISEEADEQAKNVNSIISKAMLFLRFNATNREIIKSGYHNIFDLACGYSPRSAIFSKYNYVGADLPPVVTDMSRFATQNARYIAVDATNAASLQAAAAHLEGPLYITSEGITMYLTIDECTNMFQGIASLLRLHGGVWTCPDPCTGSTYGKLAYALLGEEGFKLMLQNAQLYSKKSDTEMGRRSLDESGYEQLMSQCGLTVNKVPLLTADQKLDFSKFLTPEQTQKVMAVDTNCQLWAMHANPTFVVQTWNSQFAGLQIDYTNTDGAISMQLRGRLDSLSAPDLLELHKQLTTQSAIHSITLNTALLEYLSSAGIRVLLTLYKQYGANNFAITRPSVFVRNILSQTGLEELIR